MSDYSCFGLDEAAYCSSEIYNFACDRLRGGNFKPKVRLISTPNGTPTNNWYQRLVKDNPDKIIYGSSLDNNFTSDEYKESLKTRYIEGSLLYKQQVLGECIETEFKTAIVYQKDFNLVNKGIGKNSKKCIGIDFAGSGADNTVIVLVDEYAMLDKIVLSHNEDHFKVISEIEKLEAKYGKNEIQAIVLDNTGRFWGRNFRNFEIFTSKYSSNSFCNGFFR